MKVLVLYSTLTGNAQQIAEFCQQQLESLGHEVDVRDQIEMNPVELNDPFDFLLPVLSTWGEGDYNAVTEEFMAQAEQAFIDLTGRKFAIIGLGESYYENYARAGDRFARQLVDWGATQIGEVHRVDGYPESERLAEVQDWLTNIISQLD